MEARISAANMLLKMSHSKTALKEYEAMLQLAGTVALAPKRSPVPATHAASLPLDGDGDAALVAVYDGETPLAFLDCSKFASASSIDVSAKLDAEANLTLTAKSGLDELALAVPAVVA